MCISCNSKILNRNKTDLELGYECYHNDYSHNVSFLDDFISTHSNVFTELDLEVTKEGIEIWYSYHCYECTDDDRYMTFINFNSETEVTYLIINNRGKIICSEQTTVNDHLLSISKKTIGDSVKRDCAVEGGEATILIVRNQANKETLSYYESLGVEGHLSEPSKKLPHQRQLIKEILKITESCK